jgi:hypothetical protein
MSMLIRHDGAIELQDHWPDQDDLGRLVILPGGEAGILTAWWHAPDRSEWRWQLELSNCRHPRERREPDTTGPVASPPWGGQQPQVG